MKYKIFVSGVQKELKEERFSVKGTIAENVLLKEYFKVFLFEDSPAKSKSAKTAYIDEVRKCDIYLGILGNLIPQKTGHKLDKQDNEEMWDFEELYGEMPQLPHEQLTVSNDSNQLVAKGRRCEIYLQIGKG
jgi:restriction endonuclease